METYLTLNYSNKYFARRKYNSTIHHYKTYLTAIPIYNKKNFRFVKYSYNKFRCLEEFGRRCLISDSAYFYLLHKVVDKSISRFNHQLCSNGPYKKGCCYILFIYNIQIMHKDIQIFFLLFWFFRNVQNYWSMPYVLLPCIDPRVVLDSSQCL